MIDRIKKLKMRRGKFDEGSKVCTKACLVVKCGGAAAKMQKKLEAASFLNTKNKMKMKMRMKMQRMHRSKTNYRNAAVAKKLGIKLKTVQEILTFEH